MGTLRSYLTDLKYNPNAVDYVTTVDTLGSHVRARDCISVQARLQKEEKVRYFEEWENESSLLEIAKKEMSRWSTSGTDIMLNKIQRQMKRSFEPPRAAADGDGGEEELVRKAIHQSFASGEIEIVWQGVQNLPHHMFRSTIMLQVMQRIGCLINMALLPSRPRLGRTIKKQKRMVEVVTTIFKMLMDFGLRSIGSLCIQIRALVLTYIWRGCQALAIKYLLFK